jgi:hypothetical protein
METTNEYVFIYEQSYYYTGNSNKSQLTITYLNIDDFNDILENQNMNDDSDVKFLEDGKLRITLKRVKKDSVEYKIAESNTKAKHSGNPQDFTDYQIRKIKTKSLQYNH